jgi:mannose-1-phosphate guanylyltransferase
MRFAVIMAGGTGTRFWPESRLKRPKQFLKLIGEKTMLQTTVERIQKMIPLENILIITNSNYTDLVAEQLPGLPTENIVGEPVGKNTAPCVAAAAAIILNRDENSSMVVLPSDHYIREEDRFREIIDAGFQKAENAHCLVTIGIKPYRPETGYGYIQIDESSVEKSVTDSVYQVKTFAEKPDLPTAVRFLESGDFLWNSGMFIWRTSDIWDEFKKYLAPLYKEAVKLKKNFANQPEKSINEFYHAAQSISIDYGIMEKTDAVYVIPAEFGWNDVGSWLAIYELEEKKEQGNVLRRGEAIFENCQNCFVSSESGKLVSMVGLQGIGFVETDDAIMLCRMDKAQDVRDIVKRLEEPKLQKYR